jgi:hypothetical protein
MLKAISDGLKQPEYLHVLLNPLPLYGLAAALVAMTVALVLRSRETRICAAVLVLIASASVWPVVIYGQQGYFRVKAMSDSEGEKWLDEHKSRGEQFIYAFYALAAISLLSLCAEWRRSKAALPLAITTAVLATGTLAIGAYISYAGGQIRHKEFRFEPAPDRRVQEQQTSP